MPKQTIRKAMLKNKISGLNNSGATKDWKVETATSEYVIWKKGSIKIVIIPDEKLFVVDGLKSKKFKTKSQALKYAKAYMEKH